MTITGENITLTRKELSSIVEEAVNNALSRIAEKESQAKDTKAKEGVKVTEFSDDQYQEAMQTMAANRKHVTKTQG